jgi:hypothetical protein
MRTTSEILAAHATWTVNRKQGARLVWSDLLPEEQSNLSRSNLSRSDLSGSNLSWSNLSGSNLSGSNLSGSNLSGSNLRWSNLSGSNLSGSNLSGSNLRWSNLSGSNLSKSNLSWSDLSGSNLSGSNLSGSNLSGSNLRGSNLSNSNLSGSDLSKSKNIDALVAARLLIVPQDGELIGWKKCQNGVVVRLSIPAKSKRHNATGRKCRAEFADVLEVIGAHVGISQHDPSFEYRAGARVTAPNYDPDRWNECGGGIHFYITREEAEAH